MKHILDSPEVFETYARIDYAYWRLQKVYSKLFDKSPIEGMIDKATGYDNQLLNEAISIIEDIIRNKELIEADTARDREMLEQIESKTECKLMKKKNLEKSVSAKSEEKNMRLTDSTILPHFQCAMLATMTT